MTDYQYPTDFLAHMPGEPIREACKSFAPSKDQIPLDPFVLLQQVHKAVSVFYHSSGSCNCQCFSLNEGGGDLGIDGWNYQVCRRTNAAPRRHRPPRPLPPRDPLHCPSIYLI
jgi:lysosomal Pro-X carboxypeptidase